MTEQNDSGDSDYDGPPPLKPCGSGKYVVAQGECIASIAIAAGFSPDTLWNHGKNAELKSKRKNPNVLFPGDLVFIPEITTKSQSRGTGSSYKFKRKNVPLKLNIQLLDECRKPRGNLHYTLHVGSQTLNGNTDGDGFIHVSIPPDADSARLELNNGKEIHNLLLGNTNPVDDVSGIQSRLFNLGFYAGGSDGQFSPELAEALDDFQSAYNLPVTGKVDDATKQKLLDIHGS